MEARVVHASGNKLKTQKGFRSADINSRIVLNSGHHRRHEFEENHEGLIRLKLNSLGFVFFNQLFHNFGVFAWMYRDLSHSQMRMVFLCNGLVLVFRHYIFKDLFLGEWVFVLIIAREPESRGVIIGVISDRDSVSTKLCVLVQEFRLLRAIRLLVGHNEPFF